jgi:hypothetical protein
MLRIGTAIVVVTILAALVGPSLASIDPSAQEL